MKARMLMALLCLLSSNYLNSQISGTVFSDYNESGTRTTINPNEPLLSGIAVTAYSSSGTILASFLTTNVAAPNYSIPSSGSAYNGIIGSNTGFVPSGTSVRLEFSNLPTYTYSGVKGTGSLTSVQFVTAPSINANFGVNNPGDYFISNPLVITPRYVNGNNTGTQGVLVGLKYDESGSLQTIATANQIGTTWGVAFKPDTKTIFAAAVLKRHHAFGSGADGINGNADDISTIYIFNNYGGSGAGTLTSKIDLNDYFGVNIGTNPRMGTVPPSDLTGTTAPSHDFGVFGNEGKRGMGDIDLSEDGKTLYILNLNTPSLVVLDVTNPIAPTLIGNYPIIKPSGAPVSDTYRPWAIGVNNGRVFIGGVMSADISQSTGNLRAYVQEFTGGTFNTVDIDVSSANDFLALNNNRSSTYFFQPSSNWIDAEWRPWSDVESVTFNTVTTPKPQPILSDIDFSESGSMILSFLDRNGLQIGNRNYAPTSSNTTLYSVISGGDLRQICNTGTQSNPIYVPEGGAGCTQSIVPDSRIDSPMDPPPNRFFNTVSISNPDAANFEGHAEIPYGGLAYLKGSNSLVITAMNPEDKTDNISSTNAYFSGGFRWFNGSNGSTLRNYTLYNTGFSSTTTSTASKGIGLGDVELLIDLPPIEIGNRVWADTDQDGVQDPGEIGISGVTVKLINSVGVEIASAVTDVNGNYYFSSATGTSTASAIYGITQLVADMQYIVRIPNAEGGSQQASLTGMQLTTANAFLGAPSTQEDVRDSDGILVGVNAEAIVQPFEIPLTGANNHTFDFGFYTCPPQAANLICDNGSNGVTLTAPIDITNVMWYDSTSNTLVGTGNSINITSGTTGMSDGYEAYYYIGVGADGCETILCCPVPVATEPCVTCTLAVQCNPSPQTTCAPFNGSATTSVTGGQGNITYQWSSGETTSSITGKQAGTYTVTVTDDILPACVAVCQAIITNNAVIPSATCSKTNNTNCTTPNGTASVSTNASNPTYVWSTTPAQTTSSISNLAAGTYTVTVTDQSTGCTNTCSAQVLSTTAPPSATCSKTDNTNCTTPNGTASVSTDASNPTYVWSTTPAQTTSGISNLAAGTYTVTVTDQSTGCTNTCSAQVLSTTAPPSVSCSKTDNTNCATPNGTATATATGVTYAWSNGETTATITGLNNGTYIVIVTSTTTGCTATCQAIVANATVNPTCSITANSQPSCANLTGGSITVTPSPAGTYSYAWSDSGPNTATRTGLTGGTYTVTVTNTTTNCTGVCNITLTTPTGCCNINAVTIQNIVCNDNSTPGLITDNRLMINALVTNTNASLTSYNATVSGGTTITPSTNIPYGAVQFTLGPGTAGGGATFTVTLTDTATPGCTQTFTVTDPGNCPPAVDCPTPQCGSATIQVNGN